MSTIPDFSKEDLKLIDDTLAERYGEKVDTQHADIELRLDLADRETTECPAVYWEKGACHFILAKTDDSQYYSQFFYGNREQFGTGKKFYDDIVDCLMTTLQVQADHELESNKVKDLNT